MNLEILEATPEDKPLLRNLLELYLYDFSEYTDNDVDEAGLFGYWPLQLYWQEPGRHAFLVRIDGKLAGFVLVIQHQVVPEQGAVHAITEFFILRKYRRKGAGAQVAQWVFDRFPGKWQVAQIVENTNATNFWRKVIGRYTEGRYREVWLEDENWQGPVQLFDNGARHE